MEENKRAASACEEYDRTPIDVAMAQETEKKFNTMPKGIKEAIEKAKTKTRKACTHYVFYAAGK